METIYNSAIINRETYISITQKIDVLKKNLDTPEKIHNFIKQDDVRKKRIFGRNEPRNRPDNIVQID